MTGESRNQLRTIFLVISVVTLWSPIHGESINFNNLCLLVKSGTLVAAGSGCRSDYYACTSNGPVAQMCSNGFVFNKNQQTCVPVSQAACTNPCNSAQRLPSWVSIPGSCNGFYYCNATGAYLGSCPAGESFDDKTQQCVYASGPCTNNNNSNNLEQSQPDLCTYIPNGIYFGDAGQCANWNICSNDIIQSGTCATGYVYNVQRQLCDFPTNTPCSQVTFDPMLTASNGDTACTTQGTKKAGTQCNNYYECNGQNYVVVNCEGNLFYDTVSQTCVNRVNARNDCNRCVGVSVGFVNSYSTSNCSSYLYCENNAIKSKGVCSVGYFNEVAGACINGAQPNFACCNPSVYATTTVAPTTVVTTKAATTDLPTTVAITTVTAATSATTEEVTEATTLKSSEAETNESANATATEATAA